MPLLAALRRRAARHVHGDALPEARLLADGRVHELVDALVRVEVHGQHEPLLLHGEPLALDVAADELVLQVAVPAVPALLRGPPPELVREELPAVGPEVPHVLDDAPVVVLGPRRVDHAGVQAALVVLEALHGRPRRPPGLALLPLVQERGADVPAVALVRLDDGVEHAVLELGEGARPGPERGGPAALAVRRRRAAVARGRRVGVLRRPRPPAELLLPRRFAAVRGGGGRRTRGDGRAEGGGGRRTRGGGRPEGGDARGLGRRARFAVRDGDRPDLERARGCERRHGGGDAVPVGMLPVRLRRDGARERRVLGGAPSRLRGLADALELVLDGLRVRGRGLAARLRLLDVVRVHRRPGDLEHLVQQVAPLDARGLDAAVEGAQAVAQLLLQREVRREGLRGGHALLGRRARALCKMLRRGAERERSVGLST